MRFYSLIALACVTAGTAQADIILSNLSSPVGTLTGFGTNTITEFKAFNFVMGSANHTLTRVVLNMTGMDPMPNPLVEIWSDANGSPCAPLFALDNPIGPIAAEAEYAFTAGSPFTLVAGTSYWLYVRSVPLAGDRFDWNASLPAALPTGPGATGLSYQFNDNVSSTFNSLQIEGDGALDTTYCNPANNNSTGQPSEIAGLGSLVATDNDVTLEASNLPANAFGFFITGQTQDFIQNPGGSEGNLCISGSIGRYVGPGQIQNAGPAGVITLALDLTMTPTPTGPVAIQAGETWNFQAWHRDSGPSGPSSNFTNGLQLDFQ